MFFLSFFRFFKISGNQALESIREGLGDKKLTHAQAREHIQKRLTQVRCSIKTLKKKKKFEKPKKKNFF